MKKIFLLCALLFLGLPCVLFCQPVLYGVTQYGGQAAGSISKFESATNNLTSVFNFPNSPYNPIGALVQAGNGKLYGMTSAGGTSDEGAIFSFDPTTNAKVDLVNFNSANGALPGGSMILASNGKLYGMTSAGGAGNVGVIFSFN